jgi:alanine-glyoxylate transaminase/serine-glyoxylate transaminase/serine-pyruvate transaminase
MLSSAHHKLFPRATINKANAFNSNILYNTKLVLSSFEYKVLSSQLHLSYSRMSAEKKSLDYTPTDRNLLMIPGPIEYDSNVLNMLANPSLSHVSPVFINEFSNVIKNLRKILGGEKSQPLILSGSGTLGWDVILANLCESGDNILVINTGYFSDSVADCAESYSINVQQLRAQNIGDSVSKLQLSQTLNDYRAKGIEFKLVMITHVDTSTAVLNNVEELASAVKSFNSNILVAVDGVCSFGGETFEFDNWLIDAAHTCSQKAIGVPPGLAILLFSPHALNIYNQRKTKVPGYYINLKNWLPIMNAYENKQASYFATPNVNLIRALNVSLNNIIEQSIEKRICLTRNNSKALKAAISALGLKQVPTSPDRAANTLTAIYYPENVEASALLAQLLNNKIIAAGGLHKQIKATYFRIGTMGASIAEHRRDVLAVVEALEKSLTAVGYKFSANTAINAFNSYKP